MPGDLYYGDNLEVLRNKIATESIDLVYLDPPFNSDRTYNLIHKESQAQQHAFVDTWHWEDAAERAFSELTGDAPRGVCVPKELSGMMLALKGFLWDERRDTLAYLAMMAIRLVEMRRALRPSGTLYLHCDPTASHYLKVILDSIFGAGNFQSEIVWKRTGAHNSAKRWGPIHDTILMYTKTERYCWNCVYQKYEPGYIEEHFKQTDERGNFQPVSLTGPGTREGDSGKPWRGVDPTRVGRHWQPPSMMYDLYQKIAGDDLAKYPLQKRLDLAEKAGLIWWPKKEHGTPRFKQYSHISPGLPVQDIITDILVIGAQSSERVGYQTQKPLALLERIIAASSNPGDTVLDPFCGCGTTVEAAERLGRKWIGIDIAIRAVDVIKDRLDEKFKPRIWREFGEPSDVEEAAHLAETNAYDFQWWAVRRIGGQPPKGEKKKGGDGGIDGEMMLRDFGSPKQRRVIVSVKGGHNLTPEFVKSLESTVRLEKADYGFLITMHQPSKGMRDLAREFGTVPGTARNGKLEHRIRIITIPELLAGTFQLPGINETPRTHSAPPPAEARKGETLNLPFPAASRAKPKPPTKAREAREAVAKERASKPPKSKPAAKVARQR